VKYTVAEVCGNILKAHTTSYILRSQTTYVSLTLVLFVSATAWFANFVSVNVLIHKHVHDICGVLRLQVKSTECITKIWQFHLRNRGRQIIIFCSWACMCAADADDDNSIRFLLRSYQTKPIARPVRNITRYYNNVFIPLIYETKVHEHNFANLLRCCND